MAKAFAPPRSHNLPTTTSSPGLAAPLHSPGVPVAPSEAGPILAADSVGEREVPSRKSPTSPSLREDQDDFSLEFTRLQEEVASDREALERGSPVSLLQTGPESPAPATTCAILGTSTSPPSIPPPQAGSWSDFQIEGLIGCPLEALSSLVTPEHIPKFGHIQAKDYAELLTGKILQVHNLINPNWVTFHYL
jgi:hypothetical protein